MPMECWLVSLLIMTSLSLAVTAKSGSSFILRTSDTRLVLDIFYNQLTLLSLKDGTGKHEWIASPNVVPLIDHIWFEKREIAAHWTFEGSKRDARKGTTTFTFANSKPRLELRSVWRARPGRGPIEHWIDIENLSGKRVAISSQESLSLVHLEVESGSTFHWIRRGGSNASTEGGTFSEPVRPLTNLELPNNCEDGSSPVPWLAIQHGDEYGIYVGWEFSGPGRVAATCGASDASIGLLVGFHPDFRTDVEANETFHVPPAFVGCHTGDIDEGSYSLHRFIVKYLRPSVPKGVSDPILAYNLYLDAGGANAREADVLRSAALCHKLGFEAFMPDAMWFPSTGDWRWDPSRFPNGIQSVLQYVHSVGMRMALWCAWTNGGVSEHPGALSVRGTEGHPDWFNAEYSPDWQPGPFYGGQLCLGCREAKDWEIAKTQWLVKEHGLDYLKHDCGPIVLHCDKATHRHHYGVDTGYWATMGYYEVQEKLRKAYPTLLLENCSGGGHIKDFGVVSRTHYTVTTDTLSNLPDRQSIYDSTFALPPLILQAYTYDNQYPVKGDAPGNYLWRSAMMGAWQIDPTDTATWSDDVIEEARQSVKVYKEWIRPMLKDVKVHHILPRPDGIHWDGMLYWCERLRRGTLYIFRPGSSENEQTIRLKGLDPLKSFWIWSEDGSVKPRVATGEELMGNGVEVKLPMQYSSDLVFLRDVDLGEPTGLGEPEKFSLLKPELASDPFEVRATLRWQPSRNAKLYRVRIYNGDKVFEERTAYGNRLEIGRLPENCDLRWDVTAISAGGSRINDGGSATFTTAMRKRVKGVTFLSGIKWLSATAGAENHVLLDENYYGKPLFIGGRLQRKGLWTHAFNDSTPADIVFDLVGLNVHTFVADVGLDDASGGGSVQFQVLLDGKVTAESPVMRPGIPHRFTVDISSASRLTLRVLNGGEGYSSDHAVWGMARLLASGTKDPWQ